MITYAAVSKSFDGTPVLSDVSFTVAAGSRTALVGVNGSGKSTLLRVTAGLERPDRGTVALAPGATVAYVPQDYGVFGDRTVAAFVRERAGVLAVEEALRALERRLAEGDVAAADAYADTLERYAALGGYEIDGRVDQSLQRLGLDPALADRPVGTLSGGQQVRVGLAGVLASRFAVYLLDEPTNNLDLPALDHLEAFVAGSPATFLVVSHDRAFLDAVATDVVELDEHARTAEPYGVPYATYRDLREQARASRSARYAEHVAEVARLRRAAAATQAAARRTRDARPRRDNDQFAGHFLTQRSAGQAARAARRIERRLERLDAVEEPRSSWELRLSLDASARSGDRVLHADGLTVRTGAFTLGPLSLEVRWRQRVALHGHNGAGKSLLLAALTGGLRPTAGTVTVGSGVRVGLLAQGGADLAGEGSVVAVFRARTGWTEEQARTILAKFALGATHVTRPVATCSPGERCRLGLAVLMARGANLLVLDEPTNHLDLEATEQLEQALAGFDGTLLVVSHDREFLARVGVTRTVTLVDGRLVADEPAPARA